MAFDDCGLDSAAGGWFGRWMEDDRGHPWFGYAPGEGPSGEELVLPDGRAGGAWHQVANQAITATAHANGGVSLYSTRRGVIRLTAPDRAWGFPGLDPATLRTRFGLASAEWSASARGVGVTRRVWAPLGEAPALVIDVTMTAERPTSYEELWPYAPHPVAGVSLMSPLLPPPGGYPLRLRAAWHAVYTASAASRSLTLALRRLLARRLSAAPHHDPLRAVVVLRSDRGQGRRRGAQGRRSGARFDPWIGVPFIASIAASPGAPRSPLGGAAHAAVPGAWGCRTAVTEGTTHLRFAVGLADDDEHLDRIIEDLSAADRGAHADSWGSLLRIDSPDRPWLQREATWHAACIVGSETPDDALGHRYPMQGSAYGFVHGLQGAPRDYAITSVTLAFVDPDGAREALRMMFRLTRPDGMMHYAHTGYGHLTAGGVHSAPTDLPIWLLWALTEYVWATGDRQFLDEQMPFYTTGRAAAPTSASTVRERVLLAFRALRDRVGVGEHGMLRVGSGDWSDPIAMMVRDRRAFHRRGESGFNTAFAAYTLPRASDLLHETHPAEATEMRAFGEACRTAMEQAWNGRWFLRGWDGRGRAVGDRHLFLDGQVWCLIARIGSDAQRDDLVNEIASRCDEPSPIGATILDRPHAVRAGMLAPGWDCNGGVWAAINALLAWGYALHDPDLARRSLAKQSLAGHASAYPHVWYGIWSGPDSYNAHFGERAGETFVQPATPMTEFPVMNSNAHAGPLLAMLRVLGVESVPDGVVVRDRGATPPWRLHTALGTFGGGVEAAGDADPGSFLRPDPRA